MNSNLFRAIQGPIILITIGVLFALDQIENIGFGRTWPIIIIVIGVFKLLQRTVGRRPGQQASFGEGPIR